MPTYRVRIKEGMKHGRGDKYTAGDELVVGEAELDSFRDKLEVLEELPEQPASPTVEEPKVELAPDIAAALAEIETMLGEKFVEEDALATVEDLRARVEAGNLPKLEETVGKVMAAKLDAMGYGEPVVVFYASDKELLDVEGLGPATLEKLREVYGKVGD